MSQDLELNGLPETWAWSVMSAICEKIQDGTHFSPDKDRQFAHGQFPYVTAKNVRPWGLDLSDITYLEEADHRQIRQRCDPIQGDVLLVKDGVNAGDAAINSFDGEISLLSSVCMLRPKASIIANQFLRYFLLSPKGYQSLSGQMTGTAIKRIILRKVRETPVPVAPLPEQRRIVTKIEELFSDLDAGVAALEQAKAKLKRYRAAVLKAAVEGRLTEEWRAKHPPKGTASQLLERILKERRRKWEDEQLAAYKKAGKKRPANWSGRYKEPAVPDEINLPPLPEGWCWATMEQIASDLPRSIQSGPFGSNLHHSEFQESGVLAIGIDNVLGCRFSIGREHRITEGKFRELQKYQARPLDFLITVMATVGRCCVVPADIGAAIITKHVYRVTLNQELVNPYYIQYVFAGDVTARKQLFGSVRGQTRPGINGAILKFIDLPIPPLAEQTEIVAEVERRLSVLEQGQAQIESNLKRSSRLRQSILKRACEGKLVPQDPNDEPSSVLLERIKTNRENGSPRKATKPARKRK